MWYRNYKNMEVNNVPWNMGAADSTDSLQCVSHWDRETMFLMICMRRWSPVCLKALWVCTFGRVGHTQYFTLPHKVQSDSGGLLADYHGSPVDYQWTTTGIPLILKKSGLLCQFDL